MSPANPPDYMAPVTAIGERADAYSRQRRTAEELRLGSRSLHPSYSAAVFDQRRVTAAPTDPDVVDGALRLVIELVQTRVPGADGVSVTLRRHGELSTVCATDQTIFDMDAHQYTTGEGPCIDAALTGRWFCADSLATEERWTAFAPLALGLGINSIMSTPLRAFEQPVGAINIYSRDPMVFEPQDHAAASAIAAKTSVLLSDAGAGTGDERFAQRYGDALRGREVVALAIGVLMEREGRNENDAFAMLLRQSLYAGLRLRERAEQIVAAPRSQRGPAGI